MTDRRPAHRPALALVTGASSGIGRAFARQLARERYDLLLVARDQARLDATAEQLRQVSDSQVETRAVDLANARELSGLAEACRDMPIELLINNAGVARAEPFDRSTDFDQDRLLDTNYRAVNHLVRAVLPGMLAERSGDIINVGSISGLLSGDTDIGYAASKSAIICLTESVSTHYRHRGIRASVTCPGYVHTNIHERAGIQDINLPSLLWGTPEEVAAATLRAHRRGATLILPQWPYRGIAAASRFLPQRAIEVLTRQFYRHANGAGSSKSWRVRAVVRSCPLPVTTSVFALAQQVFTRCVAITERVPAPPRS